IVWGGNDPLVHGYYDTGGRYTPGTDTWAPTLGGLSARSRHTAIWTGSEMIVWGGAVGGGAIDTNTGGRYDPATDTLRATSTTSAATARDSHVAVWTGSRMVVWGGTDVQTNSWPNTGGRYDPLNDSWQATSTNGAPFDGTGQTWFAAVWTGTRMIVW